MYLEIAKNRIETKNTKNILVILISKILRLYHPFVPFITEELWSYNRKHLINMPESIMDQLWPDIFMVETNKLKETENFIGLVSKIRSALKEKKYGKILIKLNDAKFTNNNIKVLKSLVKVNDIEIEEGSQEYIMLNDLQL